jgi:DNA ligase-1
MSQEQPMLATDISLEKIPYPVLASPKFDGIRSVVKEVMLSRNYKPIPNANIQALFKPHIAGMQDWDGEMVVGKSFSESSSVIMADNVDIPKNFSYNVFDKMADGNYEARFFPLLKAHPEIPYVQFVSSALIKNEEQLLKYEEQCINEGYEGIILRRTDGKDRYKFGRSTAKEGFLLKFKRFADAEALIIGFEEMQNNENESKKDAFGHTDKSSKKEGMVAAGILGSLIVMSTKFGQFNVGSGFTMEQRAEIWQNRDKYKGQWAKFKYQMAGMKDKPRFPVFLGFRSELDM